MTTTSAYQIYPDFFSTPAEANSKRERIQTNPRYKGFNQVHFTAGDPIQFEEHRYPGNSVKENTQRSGITERIDIDLWDGYSNVTANTVTNTFNYIFHKFKKGIFVKIKDNQVKVFLPFSKYNYENEWHNNIKMSSDEIMELTSKISTLGGYKFNPKHVNTNIKKWYGNNSLIRYEFPMNEGDSNVGNVKNMLDELCKEREIPDTEFFVNRRDYPLLTRDRTEPYHNIWNADDKPLVSHSYEKYIPILSMTSSDRYADIAIPNHNDWSRVQSKNGKWFARCGEDYDDEFSDIEWNDKIETAVFRGTSTGTGVDIHTNMRLKAAHMSQNQTGTLLDAGITKWNLRPRKIEDSDKLRTIDVENIGINLVPYLSTKEQARYKYILHIDGHVSAFRLGIELATRSVILKVDSPWKTWFSDRLKPYVHYVPVNWDLSNLFEIIQWCKENDDECLKISKNARAFYDKYLNRDAILDYTQSILVKTTEIMNAPIYPDFNPIKKMIDYELTKIDHCQLKSPTVEYTEPEMKVFRTDELWTYTHEKVKNILATSNWETEASEPRILKKNISHRILSCKFRDIDMLVKCATTPLKTDEYIHETFVGLFALNNLVKLTGNFQYIYGTYNVNNTQKIISEFIHGQTLHEYISNPSSRFRFDELLIIIKQICMALDIAQKEYGFIHNNLIAENIIIHRPHGVVNKTYNLTNNKTVYATSRAIPVIISYTKSNVTIDDKTYNKSYMTCTNKYTDIQTLIKSVARLLIKNTLSKDDLTSTIRLVDTISRDRITNIKTLKYFLNVDVRPLSILPVDLIDRLTKK
jgi:hypothetical protein